MAYEKGKVIHGLENFEGKQDVFCFHSGTKFGEPGPDGRREVLTNGGRVLGVTALGSTLKEARAKAYEATGWVTFDKSYMRHDIGRALDESN